MAATDRLIETPDARVHVVDRGAGPPLLMLHGNPTSSYLYRDVVDRLADRFRCVVPDLPGFGFSEPRAGFGGSPADHARVIAEVVDHLDLSGYTLVAHDWGGPIGLAAALEAPERLAGMVLGNTWAWPVHDDRHFTSFSAIMGGPVGRLGARWLNLVVNLMLPLGHRRRRLTRAEMRTYRAATRSPERRAATSRFAREIVASSDFLADVEAGLRRLVDVPTAFAWPEADIAFRDSELERWLTHFPDAHVTRLPGVGHFLPSDAPDDLADVIASWHPLAVRR